MRLLSNRAGQPCDAHEGIGRIVPINGSTDPPLPTIARQQPPILDQVANRVLLPTHGLVEAREVEVAVGECGIFVDGGLVGVERSAGLAQVFEHDAEIEHEE